MIDQGIEALGDKAKLSQDEIRRHCKELFAQRFKTLLSAEGFEYDVIDAVLETEIVSLNDTKEKAMALADLKKRDYFEDLATAFKRVVRIIEGDVPGEVNQELLTEVAELALFSREKAQGTVLAVKGLNLIFHDEIPSEFPQAMAHYTKLCEHEAFAPDVAPYLQKLQEDIEKDKENRLRGST